MLPLKSLLLGFVASTATAQLLSNGIGTLPGCGTSCSKLSEASSQCGSSWACFCADVWSASGGDLTTICADSCTSVTDSTAVSAWYTANCGSDNGASEHPGGGGGAGASASGSASAPSASTSSTGVDSGESDAGGSCVGTWWECHWKWIVMIIVIAIGLLIIGFGGRYWKKKHDLKQDQNRHGFNNGITSRSAVLDDKAGAIERTDSPARTRDNFMPYGYGYSRSESRGGDGTVSPVTRGGTPFEEMEKGVSRPPTSDESGVRGKMRNVMVTERSLR